MSALWNPSYINLRESLHPSILQKPHRGKNVKSKIIHRVVVISAARYSLSWRIESGFGLQILKMKLGSPRRKGRGFSKAVKERRSRLYIISQCVVMLLRWHAWVKSVFWRIWETVLALGSSFDFYIQRFHPICFLLPEWQGEIIHSAYPCSRCRINDMQRCVPQFGLFIFSVSMDV